MIIISILSIIISSFFLYGSTLSNTIYGGDAGDLVSAIITRGIPHPPGYPLYTILGEFFKSLSLSLTPAGKITLISLLATGGSLVILFLILKELDYKHFNLIIALIVIFTLMVNYLIWLYAIIPEVFPLNTFIILLIFYCTLKYNYSQNFAWLIFCSFLIGLGISHHHTFILILPSVYFLIKIKFTKKQLNLKKITYLIISFIVGLTPLIYLPLAALRKPELIWGRADNLAGFIALITRQAYGTFVPGQFISNSPLHRLIQLTNLHFFVLADFTLVGYFFIVCGLVYLLKSKLVEKKIKLPILLMLFLFGPFFFFYANFPLRDKFELATVERFMIIFYFLLAVPYYFGLKWFYQRLATFRIPAKILLVILLIIPLAFTIKNYRRLSSLKKTIIAENLGKDVLSDAKSPAIIFLGGDTTLFNTQYVYYSDKNSYSNKIPIHASKIGAEYYRQSLKKNYPKLKFSKKEPYKISEFVNDNIKTFNIYSNEKYSLPANYPYQWVFQGILFKLVPKKNINNLNAEKTIEDFWANAKNKNLVAYYLKNKTHWLNYFPNDILRLYSTAHQNTAYYYLEANKPERALDHINQSLILNPDDTDNLFLLSVYYVKLKNCQKAEEAILKALKKYKDRLYLFQLEQLTNCYSDQSNKKRIENLIKKYTDKSINSLVN